MSANRTTRYCLSRTNKTFALTFVSSLALTMGCSGDDGSGDVGLGGATSSVGGTTGQGGATASGGNTYGATVTGGTTAANGGASAATGGQSLVGGSSGIGGSLATGGTTAKGGTTSTGGTTAKGGTTSTGGTTAKGGTTSTGGTTAKGGTTSTGGTTAKGGTTSTGGTTAKGGTTSTGGTTAKGGTTSTGGTTAKGGTTSTGGTTATGGTTSTIATACGAGLTPTVTVTTAAQLVTAFTNVKSGDVISIAAGTYALSGQSFKLSVSNVKIFGPAGKTILDYKATATTGKYGIDITGSSNTICGLTFANAADNGIHITGSSNTVDRCVFYGCFDSGLQISGPEAETTPHPANNLILNCDSYDNYDTSASGGNADGFAAKINIGAGNKFFGCVAHDNSDDGWDTFPKTATGTYPVIVENCVAYHNGYHNNVAAGNGNGFKVGSDQTGGSVHVLKNSVAFNNPSKGFDQNHNQGVTTVQNCTAVNNARNIAFQEYGGANITNTVANGAWEQAAGTDTGNVKTAATSAFTNLTPSSISRAADGTLHLNGFCVYTPSTAGAHF